jgi:hypothetical protein
MSGMRSRSKFQEVVTHVVKPAAVLIGTVATYMMATLLIIAVGRWTGLVPEPVTTCICDGKVSP